MDWYKTLTIHQRINLKAMFSIICGFGWSDLSFMFSMRDKINMAFNKLRLEGFDI